MLRDTLREMAVPAIHVTHDRDEALRLADDLAILAAGTLRQTGQAGHLTRHPADAVTARLLGWAELGPTHHDATGLHVGDLPINLTAPDNRTGTAYYRPEEVLIDTPDLTPGPALRIQTQVLEVVPTLPLARVLLNTTPPITALTLHRDLDRLPQPPGADVIITLSHHAIRVIPTETTPPPS